MSIHLNSSKSYGRQWFRLWNLAPENINSTLKQHDMDTFYDKLPNGNITLGTYSKLNTIKDGYSFNKC